MMNFNFTIELAIICIQIFSLIVMGRKQLSSLSLIAIFFIINLLTPSSCQSLTIVSSSTTVGDTSVNYTFIFTNVSSLTTFTFNFAAWSYLSYNSYSSSSKCYLFTTLMTTTAFPSNQIQCTTAATGANQNINITITNMINPSSTKPYQINVTIANSSTSLTLSRTLTVTNVPNYPLTFKSYSRVVGAVSNSITIDIIMNNYIDPTTILNLNFNSTLINITIPSTSTYSATQSTTGNVSISSWSNLNTFGNQVTLSNVVITNPSAAITYTVSGSFYFKEGNTTYTVQTVSSTLTLTPTSFNSITIASPLQYGVLSLLTIASACNYSQVNSTNTSNPAYTIVSYPSQLKPSNSSDCTSTSNTTCQHIKSSTSYTLSNFQVGVGNFTTLTLTFTSYTFYRGSYYSLCQSSASVTITYQSVTPYTLTSECDTSVPSIANTINLYAPGQSAATGDNVFITGIKGVVSNTWVQSTINGTLWYRYTLLSTSILSNGTISIPLVYNNPNQTVTNTLSQLNIFRGSDLYMKMSTSSLSLCSITSGRAIATYSLIPSNLLTYNVITMSLGLTMQIYDYAYNDYLTVEFNSSGSSRQYFLAGSLLGLTPNLTVNGVSCTFSIINDYSLNITLNNNVTLPSPTSPTLTIAFSNLVNSPAVDSYWLVITTFDGPTGGAKEILTTSALTITQNVESYSISNVSLLKNNSLTLSITNNNRIILTKNNSSASTVVSIALPNTLLCSSFSNNTVTVTWNVGILTSNTFALGTTTSLQINLGSCYVSYFSNSISFTIIQTFNTIASTSTTVSLYNKCDSTCYECTTTQCTSCFNSTYTTLNYYWLASCNSACPNGSYTSNGSCLVCHSSCQTCVGPLFTNCSSCSQNFTLSDGYCGSVCGSGKYESNGLCLNCHANCLSCLSSSVCYVCKTSAVLIGTQCQFTTCTSPCSTCFSSLTTCTSCLNSKILYESQCYDSCPSGTYLSKSGGTSSCMVVSQSNTYIPVTITGMILLTIMIVLRAYSSKKIGNESRRRQSYTSQAPINYKINVIRMASIIFSWLEIIAAIVLALKNSTYGVGSEAMVAAMIGLIIHLLCNVAFVIGFMRKVGPLRLSEDEGTNDSQVSNAYIRYRVIFIISAIITFRTYKLLSSNIFLDRRPLLQSKVSLQQTENQINNTKPADQNKKSVGIEPVINRNSNNIKISQEEIPSRKPIRSNSLGDQHGFPIIQSTISVKIQGLKDKETKFSHPFLTYLTIISLVGATLPIMVGCIVQIMKSEFSNMLFWGVDCLIVSICSLGLVGWDVWIFTNLLLSEQHSEMSSKAEEVNHTHQNLKQLAEFQIKIQPERQEEIKEIKQVKSVKKINNIHSPKRSQRAQRSQRVVADKQQSLEGVRSGIKRQCDEQTVARQQNLPALKVFDDFDQKDDQYLGQKKTKKFSTKNLKKRNNSRKRYPVQNRRRNANGQTCDDLYINFAANERETSYNATSFMRTKHSPNRSLQEESIEVGGEFEDQPPNFADISDIEQGQEPINISMSSELVQNKLK